MKSKILLFLTLFLILENFSFGENEPNDSCLRSETISLLEGAKEEITDQVIGTIVSTKYDQVNKKPDYDKDYYHFTPAVDGEVVVSFASSGNMYFWIGTKGCDKGWNISKEFSNSVTKIFKVKAGERVDLRPMCRWQRDYTINITFTPDDPSAGGVEGFVKRMYEKALGREAEEGGLKYWTEELKEGRKTAVFVAEFFFDSPEFKSKNLSDEEFLKRVYETIMDREPDKEGYEYWLERLKLKDVTRSEVVDMFVDAPEFKEIARRYGIKANDLPPH